MDYNMKLAVDVQPRPPTSMIREERAMLETVSTQKNNKTWSIQNQKLATVKNNSTTLNETNSNLQVGD